MFSRRLLGTDGLASRSAAAARGEWAMLDQSRNAASMKTLKARMRAIDNMRKITKAMKMVAAAKLKHDDKRFRLSQPFVKPVQDLFARLPNEEKAGPMTFLGMTGDKGLCGGVNNAIVKAIRRGIAAEEAKGNGSKVLMVGGKGANGLKRFYADRYIKSFEDISKVHWTYGLSAVIAESIIVSNPAKMKVCYNKYRSMVTYDTTAARVVTNEEAKTMDRQEWSKAMDVYSFEPALYEVWDDLHEFYYASVVHGTKLEGAVCEQSSRMVAMENANKNAGEMLEKISLIYNRARQAKITTELCEIISGASAV